MLQQKQEHLVFVVFYGKKKKYRSWEEGWMEKYLFHVRELSISDLI